MIFKNSKILILQLFICNNKKNLKKYYIIHNSIIVDVYVCFRLFLNVKTFIIYLQLFCRYILIGEMSREIARRLIKTEDHGLNKTDYRLFIKQDLFSVTLFLPFIAIWNTMFCGPSIYVLSSVVCQPYELCKP